MNIEWTDFLIQDNLKVPGAISNLDTSSGVKFVHALHITQYQISSLFLKNTKKNLRREVYNTFRYILLSEMGVILVLLTMENCDVIFPTFSCRKIRRRQGISSVEKFKIIGQFHPSKYQIFINVCQSINTTHFNTFICLNILQCNRLKRRVIGDLSCSTCTIFEYEMVLLVQRF